MSIRYEVTVDVFTGGVTGSSVLTLKGLGATIADAIGDAVTAKPAKQIRNGDFLRVTVSERFRSDRREQP